MATFRQAILAGRFQAFELNVTKNVTIDMRDRLLMQAKAALDRLRKRRPAASRDEIAFEQLRAAIRGSPAERVRQFVPHPLPNRAEPEMRVRHLTPRTDDDRDAIARLMLAATIRNTDRFMMIARRRLSVLERPIRTPSSAKRTWYAYAAYNPGVACRLLDILRVLYNYHFVGKDRRTPAMRLGLAEKAYSLHEILNVPRAMIAATDRRRRTGAAAEHPATVSGASRSKRPGDGAG